MARQRNKRDLSTGRMGQPSGLPEQKTSPAFDETNMSGVSPVHGWLDPDDRDKVLIVLRWRGGPVRSGGTVSTIKQLFPGSSRPQDTSQEDFEREVAARFGLVPNFFRICTGRTRGSSRIVVVREVSLSGHPHPDAV